MSIRKFYVVPGAITGMVLGFLTRDDYLNSSREKMARLATEWTEDDAVLKTKINEEAENVKIAEQRVETLREQLK